MPNDFFPLQAAVLSEYGLGNYISTNYLFQNKELRCRLFYRSIHDIYKVVSGNDVYFYKAYRQGLRKREEIQTEIDLLIHLKSLNIKAVYQIAQKDGTYIGQFQTVFGDRYGVLYTSVGERGLDDVEETAQLNENLGNYIASIHEALDKFGLSVTRWELNARSFIDDSMTMITQFSEFHNFDIDFLIEVAQRTKVKLKTLPTDKPTYGLCHGDIHGGNIRVDENNNPILFDFDFCGKGWRLYDISIYAYQFGLGCDPTKFDKREKRENQFLKGYNKIRSFSAKEISSLPIFIPFRRIFNIGTLYISLLHNTWGDYNTVACIDRDINDLKKWLDLNPVI